MFYRIFTEYRNIDRIERLAAQTLPGFTVITGTGYWQGQKEDSLIIEYVGDDSAIDRAKVQHVAEQIKAANHQEAVLVQAIENSSWLV